MDNVSCVGYTRWKKNCVSRKKFASFTFQVISQREFYSRKNVQRDKIEIRLKTKKLIIHLFLQKIYKIQVKFQVDKLLS